MGSTLAGFTVNLSLPAPAKLNLFLRIIRRRPDAYHDLQTYFALLDCGDTVHLSSRNDEKIVVQGRHMTWQQEDDLTYRAAALLHKILAKRGKALPGVSIEVEKRIPIGGGLGGGSSDAASVLYALNRLWEVNMQQEELLDAARSLGADVAVFVHGRSTWAEGRGDVFIDTPFIKQDFLVVCPDLSISTAAVFQSLDVQLPRDKINYEQFRNGQNDNDFFPIVLKKYKQMNEIVDYLSRYGRVRLSGSGATVFLGLDKNIAMDIMPSFPSRWQGFVASSIERSPLLNVV